MFSKLCDSTERDSLDSSGQKKRFKKIFSRMTVPGVSSYERMGEKVDKKKKRKMRDAEDGNDNKENDGNGEVKVKKPKKKRSWKRFRQVALTTCRYLGMGAAHLSPATMYYSPDYCMDPKAWDRSFNPSYKQQVPTPKPHWANTVVFAHGY